MRYCFLLFYAGIIILSSTGCRIDGETLVEGRLVDEHTGNAVGNGYVVVFGASKGANAYGYVAEKQTDTNGKFAFTFDGSGDMVLRGFTESGYYTDWQTAIDLKSGRNNKNLKVKMRAPSWVKMKLVNVPPLETCPMIYVWNFSRDEKGEPSYGFPYLKTDTTFIKQIGANWQRGISWSIRAKNGTDTQYSQQVYAESLDTVEVLINY